MDRKWIATGDVQTGTRSFRPYESESKKVTLSREFIDALTQILFNET